MIYFLTQEFLYILLTTKMAENYALMQMFSHFFFAIHLSILNILFPFRPNNIIQ